MPRQNRRTAAHPAEPHVPPRSRVPAPPKVPRTLQSALLPDDAWEDESEIALMHYDQVDLSHRQMAGLEITRSRLERVNLTGTHLERSGMSDVVLDRCDLANVEAYDLSLLRVHLGGTRIMGASFAAGLFRDVVFDDCRAHLTSFRGARLKNVSLRGCDLRNADFSQAMLQGATFTDCTLTGAQFSQAHVAAARFERCELSGIGGPSSLRGASVDTTDLIGLGTSLAREAGIVIEP